MAMADLVLNDEADVLQFALEVGRQQIERSPHVPLEFSLVHQYLGRNGGRFTNRYTVASPNTNPPMCAKKATPPPASGCRSEKPPSQSWKRNQMPKNRKAGISMKK